MRNLKKVLSLVLCLAMMLSVMVVGAGATYSDVDEVEHLDAVYLLSALGIVEGRDTGDFDPAANITRAEAAKLVACLNLGSNPVPNANGVSSFDDVVNTANVKWANDYIEYCVSQGSINGVGGNRFAPNSNVTGVQFAKMLLGILGYKAAEEGYTGPNWEYNVNIDAVKANLYKGLEDIDPTEALSRDDAAQMMYNALKAWTVIYLTDTTGALKITNESLMQSIYPQVRSGEGVVTAISYNVDNGKYTYTVGNESLTTTVDYTDLLGLNVVWYTDQVAGKEVVLAIYDYYNTVETGLVGDMDYDTDDFDAAAIEYVFDVQEGTTHTHKVALSDQQVSVAPYASYKAIDNDDDGDIDVVIYYPIEVADVHFVGEKYFEVYGNETDLEYTDYTVYEGIKTDDVVMFEQDTTLKTVANVSLLSQQKGLVDHFVSDNDGINTMVIGSTSYRIDMKWVGNGQVRPELAGKHVNYYVINGYAIRVTIDDSIALNNLLLVTTMAGSYDADLTYAANALFADNTINPIKISKLNGDFHKVDSIYKELEQNQRTDKYGYLAKFDADNGVYELTSMDKIQAGMLGFDGDFNSYAGENVYFQPATRGDTNAKIGQVVVEKGSHDRKGGNNKEVRVEYEIAPDAVIYVADVSGNQTVYSVKSGADIQNLTGNNTVYYAGYEKAADGHNYITFAFIKTDNVKETATMYGVLTSDVEWYDYNDKNVDYATFTIWNGTEYVTVNAEVGEVVEHETFVAGDVICYTMSNGKIINMKAVKGNVGAIDAYNADTYAGLITIDGKDYVIADDAAILGFDTSTGEGAEANLIPATTAADNADANASENGTWNNVFYQTDKGGKIVLIVVDNTEGGFEANDNNK